MSLPRATHQALRHGLARPATSAYQSAVLTRPFVSRFQSKQAGRNAAVPTPASSRLPRKNYSTAATSGSVASDLQRSNKAYLDTNVKDVFSLKDQTIVVTGGAQGIGLALALACAEVGAKIAVVDAKDQPHEDFAVLRERASEVKSYKSDVTDHERLGATFDQIKEDFGRIDGLITAAGVCPDEPFLKRDPESVRRCLDINVLGTYYSAQLAARHMAKQVRTDSRASAGSIVMIGSIAAHQASKGQFLSDYCSSKGAVLGLVREIAVELAELGIRTNAISPGYMMTDMIIDIAETRPGLASIMATEPPMKRIGDRKDLKGAAVYLLSDASAYTTGSEIIIDGGLHAGRTQ